MSTKNTWQRQQNAKRKAAGQCLDCGKPATKSRCSSCRRKHNESRKRRYELRKAAGQCTKCGSPARSDGSYCDTCIELRRQQRRACKLEVLQHYGGKCACCGESEVAFLQIDHVDNDGAAHRRNIGETSIYGWLKRNGYPDGYQVLCANCNFAKEQCGVCPHTIRRKRTRVA